MAIRRGGGYRPSPVRGEIAGEARVGVTPQQQKDLQQLKQIDGAAVDKYLQSAKEMLSRGILRGPTQGAEAPIMPPPAGAGAVSTGSGRVQSLLEGVLEGMGKLAADGYISESELNAAGAVQSKLGAALKLQDDPVLLMLPDDVVQSLQSKLFAPMDRLLSSVTQQEGAVLDDLSSRDQKALQERLGTLDAPGGKKRLTSNGRLRLDLFQSLDTDRLDDATRSRVQVGDLVAVGRSSGAGDIGVVTGKDDDGIQVEVLSGGQVGVKRMSYEDFAERNALPLGSTFKHEGQQFYVHGLDDKGSVRARGFHQDGAPGVELSGEALKNLARELAGSPQVAPSRSDSAPSAEAKSVVAAGGAEVITPASVRGLSARGGLYTSRGPNEAEHGIKYKDYNEDAAVLGVIPKQAGRSETFYAGAFDQAGGMGHTDATGAASKAAAEAFERAASRVGQGGDVKTELLAGHQEAVDEVARLNAGLSRPMMTTVASGIIKDGKAHVIACGDAQAMLFSKDGTLKEHTTPHNAHEEFFQSTGEVNGIGLNFANGITRSIGGDDPAFQKADVYQWDVLPGDYLLFLSDGVTDANLGAQKAAAKTDKPFTRMNSEFTEEQLGAVLRGCKDAEDATAQVGQYAMDQVMSGAGKPDNTTAVVVQVS